MKLATDAFAVVIALAGFAVSYTTQVLLASQHGFLAWEAWLWPGIADAAALAMILRLHFGLVRPGWYTVEAWLVFALAAGVMVGANTLADLRDPLSGAMHAMVPIVAMLVWHVIIHGRPARTGAQRAPRQARTRARRRREARVLVDGRLVSAGHARKLRARQRTQPHVFPKEVS